MRLIDLKIVHGFPKLYEEALKHIAPAFKSIPREDLFITQMIWWDLTPQGFEFWNAVEEKRFDDIKNSKEFSQREYIMHLFSVAHKC